MATSKPSPERAGPLRETAATARRAAPAAAAGLRKRLRGMLETGGGDSRFIAIACAVGVGAGLMAIALAESIHFVQWLSIGTWTDPLAQLGKLSPWQRVVAPAAGGLVLGVLGLFIRNLGGHGVPEAMEAVALRGGRLRKSSVLTTTVASALTIGSGGSVGREGPIVQIGAGVGSAIGQWLRVPADRLRTLTAAGAAGGLAAAFNAPIAGSFFALEVIARNFGATTFVPVVLCAVFATIVSRLYFGAAPAFVVPHLQGGGVLEAPLALGLGIFCGLVSFGFIVVLGGSERLFGWLKVPTWLKPALGGLLIGFLLLIAPNLYGPGYSTMDATLRGQIPWRLLVLLLLLKPFATSISLGSGGSGGVLLPSLFVGGIAGGLFGVGVHAVIPASTASAGAWALTGMAAVLAGTSHAPITAILLAFELTQDYAVILPVMLAAGAAVIVTRTLRRDSIYTEKLTARGINLDRREDLVLRGIQLGDVMTPDPPAVRADSPLEVVLARFLSGDLGTLFVTDEERRPIGQVSIHDVKAILADRSTLGTLVVAGDVSEATAVCRRDTTLADGLDQLARAGREVLAVADGEGRLVGAVTLRTITDVLAREALQGEVLGVGAGAPHGLWGPEHLHLERDFESRPLRVPAPVAGQTIRALDVRHRFDVSVIALRHGATDEAVDPDRPLAIGDVLVAVGRPVDLDRLAEALRNPTESSAEV